MKLKYNSINFSVVDVTALLAINDMEENDVCVVTDENQGGTFIYRSADVATNNGGTIFNGWCRDYSGAVNVKWFGAVGDFVVDDTAALVQALLSLDDKDILDLDGGRYSVFNSVAGVLTGDAIALTSVPRLYNKDNITIRNGLILNAAPSVSGTKYRYPTVFSIDRCSNITLENVTFKSKGESWGDTDASVGLTAIQRAEFAQQNGGHALLIVRSNNVTVNNCNFRLCGSVASFYSMSSHNVKLNNCFSNPGSLGYASYAFDSWAGDKTASGFPAHHAFMSECSTSKEGYTYGSKGCVITEDSDVSVIINGGYFADAYANGTSRDIGYAFGASSSQTIVTGATVENCASLGYTGATNPDRTLLIVDNVIATGLRKTVHQTADTSVGTIEFKYSNIEATVVGGGTWELTGDIIPVPEDLTRSASSILAMPNDANLMFGSLNNCKFLGATYGFINTNRIFGKLEFNNCSIQTDGFLYSSKNIGSGTAGQKSTRGIYFNYCDIEDVSAEVSEYTILESTIVYTCIDLSTSTITLNSTRDIELSSIITPSTFIELYNFPRDDAENITAVAGVNPIYPNSGKVLTITPDSATRAIQLPREDKYKFMRFNIDNASGTHSVIVRDYTNVTTYATLTAGQSAICWNNGSNYKVYIQ